MNQSRNRSQNDWHSLYDAKYSPNMTIFGSIPSEHRLKVNVIVRYRGGKVQSGNKVWWQK